MQEREKMVPGGIQRASMHTLIYYDVWKFVFQGVSYISLVDSAAVTYMNMGMVH